MALLDNFNQFATMANNLLGYNPDDTPFEAANRARDYAIYAAAAPTTDPNRANLGNVMLAGQNAFNTAYNQSMQQHLATDEFKRRNLLKENMPAILDSLNLPQATVDLLKNMPPDQLTQSLATLALKPSEYKNHFSDEHGVFVSDNKGNITRVQKAGKKFLTITPEMIKDDPNFAHLDPSKVWQLDKYGQIHEVGGNLVSIHGEKVGDANILNQSFDVFKNQNAKYREASISINNLEMMRDYLNKMDAPDKLKTGFGAETRTEIAKFFRLFGVDVDEEGIANVENFQAITNKVIVPLVKQLGRNPTDVDLKFIVNSEANLGKSVLGNKLLVEATMISMQGQQEYALAVEQYINKQLENDINPFTDPEAATAFLMDSQKIWRDIHRRRAPKVDDLYRRVNNHLLLSGLPLVEEANEGSTIGLDENLTNTIDTMIQNQFSGDGGQ